MIAFTIWGEPVAQGRPRAAVIGGHARMYDPAKSRNYKSLVQAEALRVRPATPLTGPVTLVIEIYKQVPKSFSKAKRSQAELGLLRPTTKPDISNILKGIEDALTGIIWLDDSQIVRLVASKAYSYHPRVEVQIHEIAKVEEVEAG